MVCLLCRLTQIYPSPRLISAKTGKKNRPCLFSPTTTMFIHNTTVYEARQEALVRKRGLYQPWPCCFNTTDLWASLAAKLQSPMEPCAYFLCPLLDHMEHKGHRDTVYHRFVCVWESVCTCVCVYALPVCEMSQICSLVTVDLAAGCIDFVSICIFLPAKSTFISSTNIDAEHIIVFSHSAGLDLT